MRAMVRGDAATKWAFQAKRATELLNAAISLSASYKGSKAEHEKQKYDKIWKIYGARSRNRTGTELPPPDFESGASTNFTTRAENYVRVDLNKKAPI